MTSNHNASLDLPRNRDAYTSSLERRTTSSTFSGSTKGYSVGSSDAGKSSTAVSNRNSTSLNDEDYTEKENGLNVANSKSKGSHRSHRSRNTGGFLLSNSTFEPTPDRHVTSDRTLESRRDHKGKVAVRNLDKRNTKKKSHVGLGIGGSPLASNVVSAPGDGLGGDSALDGATATPEAKVPEAIPTPLDVDSAQIVNLALNLSESRRNAARRHVSSPLPPLAATFGDGLAGGSLRQHLQQQRRVSRNVSPKPQRASNATPRIPTGQNNSPLNANFDSAEGVYQYHFTASTLARAEKAKTQIELMSQYRRLLQYIPPLKQQGLEKSVTGSSSLPDSPSSSLITSRTISNIVPSRQIGRQYNPLQYIRNRKVRARERKAIDGEAQGFGHLEKVTDWVDRISEEVENSQSADSISIPVFSNEAGVGASPHGSPRPTTGKSPQAPVRVKRPRIDWEVNPADMLADVFWLEQEHNKTVIEDRFGRKVFSQSNERRPISRNDEPHPQKTPDQRRPLSPELRIDTKLPEFRSMKSDERHHDSATSRVRHKIRDAARIHHGHNGSIREAQQILRARSRSSSDSSDTDYNRRAHRKRGDTTNSHDRGRDILEKQMLEMLAREAQGNENAPRDLHGQRIIESIEAQKPALKEGVAKNGNSVDGHSRSGSIIAVKGDRSKRNSLMNGSSGRASLEVPGGNPRGSLEELDSTAPNSPQLYASKVGSAFVPSIAMDLSPPPRNSSPSRNPLQRVKSKMNPFEHNRNRSRGRTDASEISVSNLDFDEALGDDPEISEKRKRSISPLKKMPSRRHDDSSKSSSRVSIRRGKTADEASGIRGLFKGSRGPVARVGDFLWKKESPVMSTSSGFSTDESDIEDVPGIPKMGDTSRESSIGPFEIINDFLPRKEKPSYLNDMPSFTSPFDHRGRARQNSDDEATHANSSSEREAREERRKVSRANLLEAPPRIDIHNASPSNSPVLEPLSISDSNVSGRDLDSRRSSFNYPSVKTADQRLNFILGLPGHGRPDVPVTGLYNIEASRVDRPSLDGKRQWSISDAGIDPHRGPMTRREIARVRALLLSSGLKAREISRRASEVKSFDEPPYTDIANISSETVPKIPKSQQHLVAARILSNDIQLSKQLWQYSADTFCNVTITDLIARISSLQQHISANLTPAARVAADDADEVGRELVTSHTLRVKRVTDKMDQMLRRRRRRLRWLRRAGWVGVEWALVGVMWLVWALVVVLRIGRGVVRGVSVVGRWLFWL
jgi:hypothetical protein